MKTTETLITDNIVYLGQGLDLLHALSDEAYEATHPPYHESSIGDHLRHCLEHYMSFLDGCDAGSVDYDARKRDLRIATIRGVAMQTIQDLTQRLRAVSREDKPLVVKMDSGGDAENISPWSESSVRRELKYLVAHTVHHYAIIGLLLRLQGHEPPADFGVAPSTIKYRQQRASAP